MTMTGSLLMLAGSLFLFLGGLGVFRMPDVYNRMQAGTKATTLGSLLFLSGLALQDGREVFFIRVFLLALFILFTNPVSSHALARAAHKAGIPLTRRSVRDCLHADEAGEEEACP